MSQKPLLLGVLTIAMGAWACGGGSDASSDDSEGRELSLAPAESVLTLDDWPIEEPTPPQPATGRGPEQGYSPPPPPAKEPVPTDEPVSIGDPQRDLEPELEAPALPALSPGAVLSLWAGDTLTSRHNHKGEVVTATAAVPVTDEHGTAVIPAGAVFFGTISDIAPAESPGGEGRMVLTFNRVQFSGSTYAVQARTDSLGTFMKGRGITAGDAGKVGAGAVIGAIAGRVIGGNRRGAAIGAAAGAIAGAGIMAATRDVDIILPAGAPVRLVLTAPFVLEPVVK